mgnify:CR=1 FL=1
MQFHHNGYVSQDPRCHSPNENWIHRTDELPDEMDVLIVGSGPAGAIAAAQLSMFPQVRTHIIERRDGRLVLGQADGIQSRSVETFQAFGFASEITEEAYRITEMSFWNPDPENPNNIVRGARPIDDEHGISEFPHLIVNQARVLDYFLRFAQRSPTQLTPNYGWEFNTLTVEEGHDYPVKVELTRTAGEDKGATHTVRAKYVIGCDGAHSGVRKSIQRKLEGDQANQAWGVMDVVVDTDFPDWRTKCSIHSKAGSILHIPREGGYLARMYVDLGVVSAADSPEEKSKIRQTPVETIIEKANQIMEPYTIDVKNVAWSSIYEVGHRLVDGFDDADHNTDSPTPRVFLTGDACHTHSAKAGQGMNVSMQDGWNIAWKLGHVLSGRAPESLLLTYHTERQPAAANLIRFDKEWSTLMATPVEKLDNPTAVEDYYVAAEEFAAGFLTEYTNNAITADTEHQELAAGFPVGRRFKSYRAMRRCDANPRHLGHMHTADGRYRIYVFADRAAPNTSAQDSKVARLAEYIQREDSFYHRYTVDGVDDDAMFDINVIYQQHYHDFEVTDAPEVFRPRTGSLRVEYWGKVWSALTEEDIFDARGISRDGAVVIVRPDQYVGAVLPLDDCAGLEAYFGKALLPQR